MTIPNFLNEAFQHGLAEHMALRDESTMYFDDAKDHPGGKEEREHLTQLHSKAVSNDDAGRNIRGYTHQSKAINLGLIQGGGEPHPLHRAIHDGLMKLHNDAAPLAQDHHVYSSLGGFNPSTVLGPDKVFKTPAHISTSTKPAVAVAHANMAGALASVPRDEHIMHFHLPKGHKGATYVASRSWHPHESEMLLKPNSTYKVHSTTEIKLKSGHTRTVWHVKPHDPTLKESTYHDLNVFRGIEHRETPNRDRTGDHYLLVKAAKTDMQHDVAKHHKELTDNSGHAFNLHTDLDYPGREHHENIRQYTIGSYNVNHALIHQHAGTPSDSPELPEHHEDNLQHADKISASLKHITKPLQSETHVYSGISEEHMKHLHETNADVVHTPAFTSTSIDPERGAMFARKPVKSQSRIAGDRFRITNTSHVLHFKLPKGYSKGAYVAPMSEAGHEREFLLDKGQSWKVTNKKLVTKRFAHKSKADNDPGHVRNQHVHVWTLEPHDHKLHEATSHDPSYFRGFSIATKGKESGDMNSLKYAHGDTPTARAYNNGIEDLKQRTREDVKAQHAKLLSTGPQTGSLGDHVDDIAHAKVLHSHTISSNKVNRALLKQHAGTHSGDDHYDLHEAGNVSAAIQHFAKPADHEMHVYSGLKHDAIKQAHDAGHTTIHMPAFTSTTINPNAATGFATDLKHKHIPGDRGTNVSGVDHVAHFKIPAGYKKGAYVSGVSEHPNEKEYLLDKGQTWKITGHKRVTNTNASSHYGKYKEVNHTHIWTLEPHDGPAPTGGKLHESKDMTEKLDEAVSHSEHFFSGTMGFDKVHGHSALVKHTGDGGKIDFTHDHEEMQKQHVSLRNSHKVVDAQAAHVIKKYTGHSASVNKHLIAPKVLSFLGQDHSRHAHLMSEAIQRHAKPLRHDVHVYSGLGNHDPSKDFDRTGTVHLPAFTSTSLNPTVALAFGPDKPKKQVTHILHFHLPKGYKKSLYVAGHSAVKDEREMLLDKGQKWQLTGVKKSKMKVEYGHNIRGEKDHHREVHVWSLRPHHSQLNEAYEHDPHHQGFKADGEAADLDYMPPDSSDDHHEEHLALHALHDSDHPDHVRHMENWSHSTHDITQHLLKGKKIDADTQELHGHMQHLIATAKPLPREHHVYSSLGTFDPSKATDHGGVFTTKAYTCTSLNPEIATMHANEHGSQKTTHIAHFKLPAGYTGGRYIAGHSQMPHEHEMVLGPNQKWKKTHEQSITSASGGKRIVHSFEPANHLHEAASHDPSVFHDAHPEGLSFKQQGHGLPDKHVEGYIKQNGTQQKAEDWSNARHTRTHQWMEDNAHEHIHLAARAEAHREAHYPEMALHTREVLHAKSDTFHDKKVNPILHAYTEESDVNHHLVKKHLTGVGSPYAEDHEENADEISHAIKAHAAPLNGTLHTYSGMKNFDPHTHFAKHNGVIHTPAFTSTSINPHQAGHFDKEDGKGESHILHFELPHGYKKGAYIAQHSCHGHEGEYLLDKGQSWKLKNHQTVKTHLGSDGEVSTRHIWTVTPHEDK